MVVFYLDQRVVYLNKIMIIHNYFLKKLKITQKMTHFKNNMNKINLIIIINYTYNNN